MSKSCIGLSLDQIELVWVNEQFLTKTGTPPRSGICYYRNKLQGFIGYETKDQRIVFATFNLTFNEMIRWKLSQKLFETCVGYHCTYKNNKPIDIPRKRRPEWLFKRLFRFYFWINTNG